ncbi:MAG: fibronectin type III domain-containing protein [Patescibacteria group bacterium]|nr:fibronectin type III domain-containing protein [Patescibacteria group bacterium]
MIVYSKIFLKKKYQISKSIFLFIFFLFIVNFFLGLSFNQRLGLISKNTRASKMELKRLEITNLSPVQTTIFWQTEEKTTGWVVFGEKKETISTPVFDERDTSDKKNSYFNHIINLRGLRPDKEYFFFIISNNVKIGSNGNQPFRFKTPKTISSLTRLEPISGKVLKENLSPLSAGVVILSFTEEKIFPLSTLVKESGEWLLTLSSFFNKETLEEKGLTGNEKVRLEIFDEQGKKTSIVGDLGQLTKKNHTVIVGKDYQVSEIKGEVLSLFSTSEERSKIEIIYPKEGSLIPGRRPLIKGTALPIEKVFLRIISRDNQVNLSQVLSVNKDGEWSYLVPSDLPLGDNQLILLTTDENKKEVRKVVNFRVIGNDAFEGRVLGTATIPAALQTPSPTPLPSPTPSYDASFTLSPSVTEAVVTLPSSGSISSFSLLLSLIIIAVGVFFWLVF